MLRTKETTFMYEILLMFPGMNDNVKIPFSVARKTLLTLAKIIAQGISDESKKDGVFSVMDPETAGELECIAQGLLEKGKLGECMDKLQLLEQCKLMLINRANRRLSIVEITSAGLRVW